MEAKGWKEVIYANEVDLSSSIVGSTLMNFKHLNKIYIDACIFESMYFNK